MKGPASLILLARFYKSIIQSPFGRFLRKVIPSLRPWCRVFPHTAVVLSDGTVTTCCQDPFGDNRFGSVYEKSIQDIWNDSVKAITSEDLYSLKKCAQCVGSTFAPFFSRLKDHLSWQTAHLKHPECLHVEIMGDCNYGCGCADKIPLLRNPKPDLDRIFNGIRAFLPYIKRLDLYNYGEPLLHEGFSDFLRRCREASSILEIRLATNGMLMTAEISNALIENKLNTVYISIHGGPGTENMLRYSKYGADYDKVLSNIRQLSELRALRQSPFPRIIVKTILFTWNDTDELMAVMKRDAKAAGADQLNWVLDGGTGGYPRSSKRFMPGNAEWNALKSCRFNRAPALSSSSTR